MKELKPIKLENNYMMRGDQFIISPCEVILGKLDLETHPLVSTA